MLTKSKDQELFDSKVEVEELAMQLADMLGAALYFAGVKENRMQEAVEAYLNAIDEVFENEDIEKMGYEDIVRTIKYLQRNKGYLFRNI